MDPGISLMFSLLALQFPASSLAIKSSADYQTSRSPAYVSPIHPSIRIVSMDFSVPLNRKSPIEQSAPRRGLCHETSALQGSATTSKVQRNTDNSIGCITDRASKPWMIKLSPVMAHDGSTVFRADDTLRKFRPRRSWQHRRPRFSSVDQPTDAAKSRVSESLVGFTSEKDAGEEPKMHQNRVKREIVVARTTDEGERERKSISRDAFSSLNPWTRQMLHFRDLRQKSLGRVGKRSGGVSPTWKEKRVWEDMDMPAWGKRRAADNESGEWKNRRTGESLAESQALSRLESLYDDGDNFETEGSIEERIGSEKRGDWEDIDMHAWGKRAKTGDESAARYQL